MKHRRPTQLNLFDWKQRILLSNFIHFSTHKITVDIVVHPDCVYSIKLGDIVSAIYTENCCFVVPLKMDDMEPIGTVENIRNICLSNETVSIATVVTSQLKKYSESKFFSYNFGQPIPYTIQNNTAGLNND